MWHLVYRLLFAICNSDPQLVSDMHGELVSLPYLLCPSSRRWKSPTVSKHSQRGRMRGSLTCSELPPRSHLHHSRRELPRSMSCRIRTASPTNGGGELPPDMRRKVRSRATSPSPAIRRFFGVQLQGNAPGAVPGKHAKAVRGLLPDSHAHLGDHARAILLTRIAARAQDSYWVRWRREASWPVW